MFLLYLWNHFSWKQHFVLSYTPPLPTAPWIAYKSDVSWFEIFIHDLKSHYLASPHKFAHCRGVPIPYNCHFFYTDTIFVRIKFTPKNADFHIGFGPPPGSRIHASPRAWLGGSEQPRRLPDQKYPLFHRYPILVKESNMKVVPILKGRPKWSLFFVLSVYPYRGLY